MRVYIPFDDGSSVSFDGKSFTVYKSPKDISAVDKPGYNSPCKAEIAWSKRWGELVRALENAYRKQEKLKRDSRAKKIYRP